MLAFGTPRGAPEVRKGKSRKSGPSLKFRLIQHYWGSPRVLYGFWERSSVPPLSGRFSQVRAREGGLRRREYPIYGYTIL